MYPFEIISKYSPFDPFERSPLMFKRNSLNNKNQFCYQRTTLIWNTHLYLLLKDDKSFIKIISSEYV